MVARSRFLVEGIVQGVGFRPFVYQLAVSLGLGGWVLNSGRGVVIEVEGDASRLTEFGRRLTSEAPPLSRIRKVVAESLPPIGHNRFSILQSQGEEPPTAVIPADTALCADCAREMDDTADRRFGYPFINCTNCGPRFTIVEGIPYDRERTTMRIFPMCPDCLSEYSNPRTRRFHAEPNACPVCGPEVWMDSRGGGIDPSTAALKGPDAIARSAQLLRGGAILALKGLGGFHLACDARNADAVARLRARKRRAFKPLAVMCRDLDEVRRLCKLGPEEESYLTSPQSPILLLRKRADCDLAEEVAPDNRYLGVMLPYTPLHRLLMRQSPPTLVMTSGNLSEEPIAHDNLEAQTRLAGLADDFLWHNRPIHSPCDDSVARVFRGELCLIRRSRGFVPTPIPLPAPGPDVLACGAEQKNTFCLARGDAAVLSQHIGDMDNAETADYFERAVEHFKALFQAKPTALAHDLHPGYRATAYARRCAVETGVRLIGVQHHHAHIAACMAEHDLHGRMLGVAFDGVGYGTDGTLWGGEFLLTSYEGFRRLGHLRPVRMPGGEAAIRRPYRMAYAHLLDAFSPEEADRIASRLLPDLSPQEAAVVKAQTDRGLNSPYTSGMGRLFDAVSALLGFRGTADYEGHPAVHLEMTVAQDSDAKLSFELVKAGELWMLDSRPVVRDIVHLLNEGVPSEQLAGAFHTAVAEAVVQVCARLAEQTGERRVCLSGGCFQNLLLLEETVRRLEDCGLQVFWHSSVPANDGGLSLGQAAVARAVITSGN
ncbi:MAG: carbamoyltransferase HypF [Armatimonadota bacterium]